jgi:hypothetical protein
MKIRGALRLITLLIIVVLGGAASQAQEGVHGKFTLTHEVHWGPSSIPAGEYEFSSNPIGPSRLLLLQKVDGRTAGFLVLARDVETATSSGPSQLTVVSYGKEDYVASMTLARFGVVMTFPVPRISEKEIAQVSGTISGSPR